MFNLQLNVIGLEDSVLKQTDNKQIKTFLNPNYDKHPNFSMKTETIFSTGKINFSQSSVLQKYIFNIPKSGHFIRNAQLYVEVPPLNFTSGTYAAWTNGFMYTLIEQVDIEIGGVLIDSKKGIFLDIETELSSTKLDGVSLMSGKESDILGIQDNALTSRKFILNLDFWFNKDLKNTLPIILLQEQEINIIFYFKKFEDCIIYDGITPPDEVTIIDSYLLVEYFQIERNYMRTFVEETRKNTGLNYLISKTVSINGDFSNIKAGVLNYQININFEHPITELFWVVVEEESINNNDYFNYSRRIDNGPPILKAKIDIDGFEQNNGYLDESYYRMIEPFKFNYNIPRKYINVFSYSLRPECIDPAGSLNFSALNSFKLSFIMNPGNSESRLYVFGKNYNIFTIKYGKGFLKYI